MPPMIELGHGTHVGLRRTRNEDTYHADIGCGLFLVADGMGGHQQGDLAAALARDAVVAAVHTGQDLNQAIGQAATCLADSPRQRAELAPMGTTIAALRVRADGWQVAWVGDSRIYRWQRELEQVSHDHSLVQELVEAGTVDPARAAQHRQRGVLTQALGVTPAAELHIGLARGQLARGMAFLLCSDGLTECVNDATIARIVARTDLAAQECVDHLLLAALDGGGRDNITAVLVRCR